MDKENLKKAGLKVTLPRRKILDILETAENHHMSAEDIYGYLRKSGEEIGLATVYRVLTQFEEAGLVARHHFETGQSVFELASGQHHDHLICVKCNQVKEFYDDVIEAKQQAIADKAGFQMTDHSLIIYGVCANCQ